MVFEIFIYFTFLERDGLDGSLVLLRESGCFVSLTLLLFFFTSSFLSTFLHHGLLFLMKVDGFFIGVTDDTIWLDVLFYFSFIFQFLNMLPMHNAVPD